MFSSARERAGVVSNIHFSKEVEPSQPLTPASLVSATNALRKLALLAFLYPFPLLYPPPLRHTVVMKHFQDGLLIMHVFLFLMMPAQTPFFMSAPPHFPASSPVYCLPPPPLLPSRSFTNGSLVCVRPLVPLIKRNSVFILSGDGPQLAAGWGLIARRLSAVPCRPVSPASPEGVLGGSSDTASSSLSHHPMSSNGSTRAY